MTPLQNNKSFLDSICSFKLGLFNAISEALRILQICLFSGVANKIFQENLWLRFSFKCFAGSESLEVLSCSSHRSSKLHLVSLMYVCSQTYTPSYMTHEGVCVMEQLELKVLLLRRYQQLNKNSWVLIIPLDLQIVPSNNSMKNVMVTPKMITLYFQISLMSLNH